jgi:hypothetical protein
LQDTIFNMCEEIPRVDAVEVTGVPSPESQHELSSPCAAERPPSTLTKEPRVTQPTSNGKASPSRCDVLDVSRPDSEPRSSTTSFTLFPKLPFELREMILTSALSVSRIIELARHQGSRPHKPADHIALMSVCHESRMLSLTLYHLASLPSPDSSTFCFSPKNDICLLDNLPTLGLWDWHVKLWNAIPNTIPNEQHNRWDEFRSSVMVLALDPLLPYPSIDFSDRVYGWEADIIGRVASLAYELSKFGGLRELIFFKRKGGEEHIEDMWLYLKELLVTPAEMLPTFPKITYLSYECGEEESAFSAMKRALSVYMA